MELKRKWTDGTSHILLSPLELIGRLAVVVPPKGSHNIRYHGCLAPRSKLRALIVPEPPAPEQTPTADNSDNVKMPSACARRILWADLLRRVFRHEVDPCSCGGKFRLVAFIVDQAEAQRYLEHQGLPSHIPETAPARAPPQLEMELAAS